MFWIPLAMAGMSLLQSQQQNAQIKAQNKINASNTRIANIQQNSQSVISAAKGALSRVTQALQLQEGQRQAGLAHNQLQEQRAQLGDQMTKGGFTNRVNAAAQAGALQARASAAGIGGSTVDMLGATMKLTSDMSLGDMQQEYSDNLYAADQADEENLYAQYGMIQQQNLYLDDVAAAPVIGAAKIPEQSTSNMLLSAGMSALSAYSSVGGSGFGVNSAINGATASLKNWFSPSAATAVGANDSFFKLGGRV